MWAPFLSLAGAQAGKARAAMQPLTIHGTILKHQFIQDRDSFFRMLGIYREIFKNPIYILLGWPPTSFTGFDLLARSFKTHSKLQNSKSSVENSLWAWLGQLWFLSARITNHTQTTAGYLCILYFPKINLQSLSFPHCRAVSSQSWGFWSIIWLLMQLLLASGGEHWPKK